MDFTFWEAKAIKLPLGPVLMVVVAPAAAMILIGFLSVMLGGAVFETSKGSSGPSLKELQAIEAVLKAGDPKKIDEMIKAEGAKVSADAERWALVFRWKNKTLFELYRQDLLVNVQGQIEALVRAQEAAAAAARAEPEKGGGGGSGGGGAS